MRRIKDTNWLLRFLTRDLDVTELMIELMNNHFEAYEHDPSTESEGGLSPEPVEEPITDGGNQMNDIG